MALSIQGHQVDYAFSISDKNSASGLLQAAILNLRVFSYVSNVNYLIFLLVLKSVAIPPSQKKNQGKRVI